MPTERKKAEWNPSSRRSFVGRMPPVQPDGNQSNLSNELSYSTFTSTELNDTAASSFMDIPIKRIQIFGERCSGTTYLERLLRDNLEGMEITWDFGWKHFWHGKDVEIANRCLFVVIYRNPFDWLKSLHRNPWHAAPELRSISFSEFIRKEWRCIWDEEAKKMPEDPMYGKEMMFERDPDTHQRFPNVMRLRTAKTKNWESLKNKTKNNVFIRYEDLIKKPRAFINFVSDKFEIKRVNPFKGVEGYKGEGGKFKPKIYDPINKEDLDYILSELDSQLEKSIGYNIQWLAARAGSRPQELAAQ